MSNRHYDVVVIGGGPAGAMTSYYLARQGVRVAVLEAKAFPRDKPCGGGLQARVISHIPFDISPIIRGRVRRIALSYGLTRAHTRTAADPLVFTVLRSEFDQYLLDKARESGAIVRQGTRVQQIATTSGGKVKVVTESDTVTCDCAVGADGANSTVNRLLNPRSSYFWQAGVYCEVPEAVLERGAAEPDRMLVDWGTVRGGYAWAFPKTGSINIGAGGPTAVARHLRTYASEFAVRTGLVRRQTAEQLKFTGHQLPTLTNATVLAKGRLLLVGDAAGLVDPFTGDGISAACHSAYIAAQCIIANLGRGISDVGGYAEQLYSALAVELLRSRKLLTLSIALPRRIYSLFAHSDRAWQTFCRVVCGQDSFDALRKEVLGPFGFASKAIEFVASLWEARAIGSAACSEPVRTLPT
ncbi:MAG TPA: NAD(P)/FAD-dependent oxidoreductase [Bryobacteraceae bacterium]|nr:NAD(P)/FAD-dependent oxidoreductase [Bryobacteraceae bacterium]